MQLSNYFKRRNEILELFIALVIAAALIYYVPHPLNKFLFLSVLLLVWRSDRDYFWIAFFFIIEDTPGGLFSGGLKDDIYRLPLYAFIPGFAFTIREFFFLLLVLKIIFKPQYRQNKPKIFFANQLKLLALLFIVLLIISPLMDMSFAAFKEVFKTFINLTLFYSLFYMIKSREQLVKFFRLLFPFTFIALILQIYGLVFHHQLINALKPNIESVQGVFNEGDVVDRVERPIELIHTLLVCFTGSLLMMKINRKDFSMNYLWIINILSFVSVLLTATRSWFIAFCVGYVLFFILSKKSPFRLITNFAFAIGFVYVLGFIVPTISNQINESWSRLETIGKVANGDITGGGTIERYDQRAPKVMQAFENSSFFFGAGFSDNHMQNKDFHVGYHNLLLNTGIIGLFLFALILMKIFFSGVFYNKMDPQRITANAFIIIVILLILNSATQTIGYNVVSTQRFFLQAYSLVVVSVMYNYAAQNYLETYNVKTEISS